jgi:hypothetical protein
MTDEIDNLQPLEPVAATELPSLTCKTFADAFHGIHDRRIVSAEANYLLG